LKLPVRKLMLPVRKLTDLSRLVVKLPVRKLTDVVPVG